MLTSFILAIFFQNSQLQTQSPTKTFHEFFAQGINSSIWNKGKTEGRLSPSNEDGLTLYPNAQRTSMGTLTLNPQFLAKNLDWNLTIILTFPHIGSYGNQMSLLDTETNKNFLRVLSDAKSDQLWAGDADFKPENTTAWPSYPITRVESNSPKKLLYQVQNRNGHLAFFVNKKPFGTFTSEHNFTLQLGNPADGLNPGDWSTLQINEVKIQYLSKELPPLVASATTLDDPQTTADDIKIESSPVAENPSIPSAASIISNPESANLAIWHHVFQNFDETFVSPVTFNSHNLPVISGTVNQLVTAPLQLLEVKPISIDPNSKPSFICLQANGTKMPPQPVYDPAKLPSLPFQVPNQPNTLVRLLEIASVNSGTNSTFSKSEIFVENPAQIPTFTLIPKDEKATLQPALKTDQKLILFENQTLVGIENPNQTLQLGPLKSGTKTLNALLLDKDGTVTILKPISLTIPERFNISAESDGGSIVLQDENSTVHLIAQYKGTQPVTQLKIFVNGFLKQTVQSPNFDGKIAIPEIPSGTVHFGVAGVTQTGAITPIELHEIQIINKFNDSLVAKNQQYQELNGLINQMANYDAEVAYWYEKAIDEPEFRTYAFGREIYTVDQFGNFGSIGYIDAFTVPGDAAEYFANCKAAIMKRAGFRLKIARLELSLGMIGAANQSFNQVIAEAGENSEVGTEAKNEKGSK